MPTINIRKSVFDRHLGESFDLKKLDDLCFEFGLEVEETSDAEIKAKETGNSGDASTEPIFKIEVAANRTDMLCAEGITRAIKMFLGKIDVNVPLKTVDPGPGKRHVLKIDPSTASIRPFAVAAILRGVAFDPERYESFIDLQDKLHLNTCRRRTLVAIGTHDLDTIQGPFTYYGKPPQDICFKPLNQSKDMRGDDLMDLYEKDIQLRHFLPIIRDSKVYPVIYDNQGIVLSLPPIINGDHSKITLNTKNIFIECTATDRTKANIVINTIVSMFSQYCSVPFEVEQVEVISPDGSSFLCPDLSCREMRCDIDYLRRNVGMPDMAASDVVTNIKKMGMNATLAENDKIVVVSVPVTRSDVLHPCDVVEDLAIGYGFNKVPQQLPNTICSGRQQPLNQFSDLLRNELAYSGFIEVLTMSLCSMNENFDFVKLPRDGSAVVLANPATLEFEIVRTSLLPGLLKTIYCNSATPPPHKFFEVSDVVVMDSTTDVGARNIRRAAAIYSSVRSSGFEIIHGVLDRLMGVNGVGFKAPIGMSELSYDIVESSCNTFFPGRRVDVMIKGIGRVGTFGVVHPDVLAAYDIKMPCTALEIDIEWLV